MSFMGGICTNCDKSRQLHILDNGVCGSCSYHLPKANEKRKKRVAELARINYHQNTKVRERIRKYQQRPDIKERTKRNNRKRTANSYGLTLEQYNKITSKCAVCAFSAFVELHHLNNNPKDNRIENLIGLCPNHHRILHVKGLNIEQLKKL